MTTADRQQRYREAHPDRVAATKAAFRGRHPEKSAEYSARYRESLSETEKSARAKYMWRYFLMKKYGKTVEWYNETLAAQGGHCAICPATEPGAGRAHFHVDHDHVTGEVRGLLCHACNIAIGLFREDESLMARAVEYLRFWRHPALKVV